MGDCERVIGLDVTVRVWADRKHGGLLHHLTLRSDAMTEAHDAVERAIAPMVAEENARVAAWAATVDCPEGCVREETKVGPTPITYAYVDLTSEIVQCTGRFDVGVTVHCHDPVVAQLTDLERALLAAAAERSDVTALLEQLRALAASGRVAALAEAISWFAARCAADPDLARRFAAAQLPGILAQSYFPSLGREVMDRFMAWSIAHPDWHAPVAEAAHDGAALAAAVARVVEALRSG